MNLARPNWLELFAAHNFGKTHKLLWAFNGHPQICVPNVYKIDGLTNMSSTQSKIHPEISGNNILVTNGRQLFVEILGFFFLIEAGASLCELGHLHWPVFHYAGGK